MNKSLEIHLINDYFFDNSLIFEKNDLKILLTTTDILVRSLNVRANTVRTMLRERAAKISLAIIFQSSWVRCLNASFNFDYCLRLIVCMAQRCIAIAREHCCVHYPKVCGNCFKLLFKILKNIQNINSFT